MAGLAKYLPGVERLLRANSTAAVAPASLAGKTVFFYFTASWCPHCDKTAQSVLPYYARHHRNKNFEVVVVSWDDSAADFAEYMKVDLMPPAPSPEGGEEGDETRRVHNDADENKKNHNKSEEGLLYLDIKEHSDTIAELTKAFRITGIPAMIGVDADSGKRVTVNALTMIDIDPEGERYPWW